MAAFTFLKAHNKWYAHYYEEQHSLIRSKAKASEFRIKTFDLMIKRQGIECAAFPWLYPILGRAFWLFSQIVVMSAVPDFEPYFFFVAPHHQCDDEVQHNRIVSGSYFGFPFFPVAISFSDS